MDIITFGFAVCDVYLHPVQSDLFEKGRVTIGPITMKTGGDALNCAIACSKFGLETGAVFKEGKDLFGAFVVEEAKKTAVDISHAVQEEGVQSSTSFILIDEADNRNNIFNNDAGNLLSYGDMDMDYLKQAKVVHFGSLGMCDTMDNADAKKVFQELRQAGVKTSMDTCFDAKKSREEYLGSLKQVLPYTSFFLPSEEEALAVTGKTTIEEVEEFFRPYGIEVMVVKLGKKGCYVTDFKTRGRYLPSLPAEKVVDTTGCGDTFCAGFLSSYVWGWDMERSAMFAMTVGALNCAKMGATSGVTSKGETLAYLRKNKGCFSLDLQAKIDCMNQ